MRRFKDSGVAWIGEIPEEWDTLKIKYIKSENKNSFVDGPFGSSLKSQHFVDDGDAFVIESGFATQGTLNEDNLKTITKEHFGTISRSECTDGDIIIAKIGEHFGMSNILPALSKPSVVSGNSLKLTVSESHFTKYMWYALLTDKIYGNIDLLVNGTGQPALSLGGMNEEKLPVPNTIEEEIKIASFLDRKCYKIDLVTKEKEVTNEKLKEYRQSVIHEAVTKGLDKNVRMKSSGIEWIGDVPEKWGIEKLKFHADLNPTTQLPSLEDDDEVSFVPMENLKHGYHTVTSALYSVVKKGYQLFITGDILMAKVTPCLENGNIAIANNLEKDVGFGSTEINNIRCHSIVNKYLFYFLQTPKFIERATFDMFGVAGLKRLVPSFIPESYCPIPSFDEQTRIANYLDRKCAEIDSVISANENIIQKLKEYRQSVIYEVVTGKVEV